jgi:hypothetical protein
VGPRAGLDVVDKFLTPTGNRSADVQPVSRRYTDWAIYKWALKETRCDDVSCICLPKDVVQGRDLVNMVINLRVA